MGYACPVCAAVQVDAEHLADHLAFTAILGDDDHEAWLEANAPGWADGDADDLAERIVDDVETVELEAVPPERDHDEHYPGVAFEDVRHSARDAAGADMPGTAGTLDQQARDALEEAYEMTRQLHEDAEETASDDAESDAKPADDAADETE